MEIRYVETGLANNFGSYVEVNEHLKGYPELHDQILGHELKHTPTKGFTKQDFLLDLAPSKINYWKLFKFMCIYPKTFLQFAPLYYQKGKLIYDINLLIVWSVLVGLLVATYIML